MAPGEYSDGHRQQLHRELQRRLREDVAVWHLPRTRPELSVPTRVVPEQPTRSRGCQLQAVATPQARPAGEHIAFRPQPYEY
eukprot:1143186-Pleurochrysis_carterae.AAC.1